MKLKPLCSLVLSLFLAFQTFPLFAADQFLDSCLKITEARDPRLIVAREQLRLSKVKIAQTARSFFPSLEFQRKESRGIAGETTTEVGDAYQSEALGFRATQPIYEGGRQMASYRYACLTETAARYNYTKTREEVFYNVKLAYYELLALKMEYAALKKAYADIDKLQEKVKNEYSAKAISELDLVEAQNLHDKVANLFRTAEMNLNLSQRKLLTLVCVNSLDNIPELIPESLPEDMPEIAFTLQECLNFASTNNLDLKIAQTQLQMAEQKKKIVRSKVIPKIYLDGYYGQSGEAYVDDPLELATTWSIMGKISWGLWGNSLEIIRSNEKSAPSDIVDTATRTDVSSLEVRLSLLDDMNYFSESKESKVGYHQAEAELKDTADKNALRLEKVYNSYDDSLRSTRTLKDEITFERRKLEFLKKQNELYEVPTVQVMDMIQRYTQTLASFSQMLYTNCVSVVELERMTLMSLR